MGFLTGLSFAAFYPVAGLPLARWADSRSRTALITAGLVVWSAMTAVSGAAVPVRGQAVAAAVVMRAGWKCSADALREKLRAELSAYEVRKHYVFYESRDLPFTDSGRIRKNVLAEMLAERIAAGE